LLVFFTCVHERTVYITKQAARPVLRLPQYFSAPAMVTWTVSQRFQLAGHRAYVGDAGRRTVSLHQVWISS